MGFVPVLLCSSVKAWEVGGGGVRLSHEGSHHRPLAGSLCPQQALLM